MNTENGGISKSQVNVPGTSFMLLSADNEGAVLHSTNHQGNMVVVKRCKWPATR